MVLLVLVCVIALVLLALLSVYIHKYNTLLESQRVKSAQVEQPQEGTVDKTHLSNKVSVKSNIIFCPLMNCVAIEKSDKCTYSTSKIIRCCEFFMPLLNM